MNTVTMPATRLQEREDTSVIFRRIERELITPDEITSFIVTRIAELQNRNTLPYRTTELTETFMRLSNAGLIGMDMEGGSVFIRACDHMLQYYVPGQ